MTKDESAAESVYERVDNAIATLIGDGPLRERLESAAITLDALEPDEFPEALQEEFEMIMHTLTGDQRNDRNGAIKDTVSSYTNRVASSTASAILRLHERVVRLLPHNPHNPS
jgi:hypothetical protein